MYFLDIDECALNTSKKCDSKAACYNIPGSYECKCKDGYSGDGFYCNDINECLEDNICHDVYFNCINNLGSYECVCKNGFVQASNGVCMGN
jgi:fibulin 1/2